MGCSPSHALIINSSRTESEPLCLQPKIYMVSESTLRILQDVGELRLYQQEDKDPGIARVRFGTNTLDQLENPVGYQSQVMRRQSSIDSEQDCTVSRKDSKITVGDYSLTDDEQEDQEDFGLQRSATSQSSNSSSSTLIVAQVHNPLSLKSIAKESVDSDEDGQLRSTETPELTKNTIQSNHSSCDNLQEKRVGEIFEPR